MKTLPILALLALTLVSGAAHAAVTCTISVPSIPGGNNYDRDIYSANVVENPSADPMDRTRARYLAISPDASAVKPLSSAKIDSNNLVTDDNASPGDTILWFQELTSKDYISIIVSTLKADRTIDKLWDGHASGQIPAGADLYTFVVKKGLAASCARK